MKPALDARPCATYDGGMRIRTVVVWLALLVVPTRAALAGDTVLGESCDLARFGASDKQAFLDFDRELRAALSTMDPSAIALLVRLPLRVNLPEGGAMELRDVRSLQARLAETWPAEVRSGVLNQKTGDFFCNYTGIMYGHGQVWVEPASESMAGAYRVVVVNLPAAEGAERRPAAPALEFVCNAEKHRVVVDADGSGKLRYRSWNKPRLLAEVPDLEISPGTRRYDGTGPCVYATWTFKNSETEYSVSERGCPDYSVPSEATGELTVSTAGKLQQTWWCR